MGSERLAGTYVTEGIIDQAGQEDGRLDKDRLKDKSLNYMGEWKDRWMHA
jgi:hypothetical protein